MPTCGETFHRWSARHSPAAQLCGMPESGPLARAQQDIRAAQALPDNLARREHIHAAQQHAPADLVDDTSTPEQKSVARLYIKQAGALTGDLDRPRTPSTPDLDRSLSIE
jgi:hypothetical protein